MAVFQLVARRKEEKTNTNSMLTEVVSEGGWYAILPERGFSKTDPKNPEAGKRASIYYHKC